jgi:hypothetical protein
VFEWREREDPGRVGNTVWSLFPSDSKYFAPSQAAFMVNYRVRDLDRMLAQLRAQGVAAEGKVSEEFNGRFAWWSTLRATRSSYGNPRRAFEVSVTPCWSVS